MLIVAGFAREHTPLHVWFTDEAIDIMVAAALEQQTSAFSLARSRFEHLPHALHKVSGLSGQESFPISAALARELGALLRLGRECPLDILTRNADILTRAHACGIVKDALELNRRRACRLGARVLAQEPPYLYRVEFAEADVA